MGGRGVSYAQSVVSVFSPPGENEEVNRIPVIVKMNPVDRVYVNAETTLRELEQEKRTLDKEQLQIIDQYGYVTTAYQGTEHSVAVDTHGLKEMRGNIVTHNHPSRYGGTFSDADIRSLQCGMRELRASAVEGVYSIRAGNRPNPHGLYDAMLRDGKQLQAQMKQIAAENAKKKFSSYEKYLIENRRTQLEVLHSWYQKKAPEYGYNYTFTPT